VQKLSSSLREKRLYRAIALNDPSDFADTEAAILRIVKGGGTLVEVTEALHSMVLKVASEHMAKAPDATLLRFARHLVTTVDHLARVDGDACYAYLFPSRSQKTFSLPPTLEQEELDVEAELIEGGAAHPVRALGPRDAERWLQEVGERMWRNDPADARTLSQASWPEVDHRRACRAMEALYRQVLSLPSPAAAMAMRALLSDGR
jgi:hypothetical protein